MTCDCNQKFCDYMYFKTTPSIGDWRHHTGSEGQYYDNVKLYRQHDLQQINYKIILYKAEYYMYHLQFVTFAIKLCFFSLKDIRLKQTGLWLFSFHNLTVLIQRNEIYKKQKYPHQLWHIDVYCYVIKKLFFHYHNPIQFRW